MRTAYKIRAMVTGAMLVTVIQCGRSSELLTTLSDDTDERADTQSDDTETGEDTRSSDSSTCGHAETSASKVLLIGDSWISIPGPGVGDMARAAGAVGADDDYVYAAFPGATIENVVAQYENNYDPDNGAPKVVIMNGGAVDTYMANGSAASILQVSQTFADLLDAMADDGTVEHLIYVLYAEGSSIPGIPEMRPIMQTACAQSAVPCYFLDLQPVWEGHPEYTSFDTINPSVSGAAAIAEAIWQLMQENCIAQ